MAPFAVTPESVVTAMLEVARVGPGDTVVDLGSGDGRIPIDNNWAERAVKAIALGRNAYMFAGSDAAGRRSATFYSFVATCLQHEVDPYDWLAWVLPRIATTRNSELGDLLPINWKRDREQRAAA